MGPNSSSFSRTRAFNQNLISGTVLFFTVGIYLAVLGLGAGGGKPTSQRVSDISNSSLYSIFAVFGFFTGSILNKIGPQITMTLGVLGYPIYVAGLFYFDRTGQQWFPILGGIVLGFCAPMLWSVSGFIQWAYATEAEKGKFISTQYCINQVGSVTGSLVAFIIIYKGTSTADGSPTPVYITFIILQCLALIFTIFGLVNPRRVQRADETPIAIFDNTLTFTQELQGLGRVLRDYRVLAMLPVIFSCELVIGILPSVNAHYFSLRTRAMNNVLFYLVQLPSSGLVAYLTDQLPFDRKTRGFLSLTYLGCLLTAAWVALLVWVSVSSTFAAPPALGVDWTDGHQFAGPFVLYLVFGVVLCCHQLIGMWVMGTFTNDPRVLAIYGGLWKGVSGAGVCVQFGMAAGLVSYQTQIAFALALQLVSIPIMFFLVSRVRETNYGVEVGVVVPHYAEEKFHAHTITTHDEKTPESDSHHQNEKLREEVGRNQPV